MSAGDGGIYSYDEVPYRSWPYAQSHPDRLATMAALFGLQTQPADLAYVLELGCAGGGNLMPMAEMLPNSRFLGIDLSARQVDEGRAVIQELGLENIELRQMDILDVTEDLGTFHYVIAHGIYSWAADDVQDKIFEICRRNLEPNGVAYVSYNTYPGWRMRGMIRDMLVYHVQQFDSPRERVEQARALLKFLADSVPTQESPYGRYLRSELELFEQADDAYLFHDHLERVNEPVYFHEFVARAESHGLQYLGESHLSVMASRNFAKDVDETLQRISRDIIQIEQYMDFLRHRTFRQTLLCHGHQPLDRTLDPHRAQGLYFSSMLNPDNPDMDVRDDSRQRFTIGSVHIETSNPLIKAALLRFSQLWPLRIPFEQLLDEARRQIGQADTSEASESEILLLGEHLIRCYACDAVQVYSQPPRFVAEVSDRPAVSPLARWQAGRGPQVTNRKHETVTLDEFGRRLLLLLNGERQRPDLLERLEELVKEGQLPLTEEGDHRPANELRELLSGQMERALRAMARAALLVG